MNESRILIRKSIPNKFKYQKRFKLNFIIKCFYGVMELIKNVAVRLKFKV